jgi:hypothetical protein
VRVLLLGEIDRTHATLADKAQNTIRADEIWQGPKQGGALGGTIRNSFPTAAAFYGIIRTRRPHGTFKIVIHWHSPSLDVFASRLKRAKRASCARTREQRNQSAGAYTAADGGDDFL